MNLVKYALGSLIGFCLGLSLGIGLTMGPASRDARELAMLRQRAEAWEALSNVCDSALTFCTGQMERRAIIGGLTIDDFDAAKRRYLQEAE